MRGGPVFTQTELQAVLTEVNNEWKGIPPAPGKNQCCDRPMARVEGTALERCRACLGVVRLDGHDAAC